jgi:GWxTD domain-containing protein
MPVLRKLLLALLSSASLFAAAPSWLDMVAPVITPAEKKTYLLLSPEGREHFEEQFWSKKFITGDEYFRRLQYIDANFGSGKLGSGANTDPGRVYLSLGPPTRVTHLPSSRIFVPMEIWYYDNVPAIHLTTELRLIFFQKNSIGFLKLYSPTLDTLRALLLPEAATDGMFGPNDSITEADIRNNLTVPGAEDEVISAAVNVATGIKYSGNDQILGEITSPQFMLGRPPDTQVRSRLVAYHPKLDLLETKSPYGGVQVDLGIETSAQREIDVHVLSGTLTLYQNQLLLKFPEAKTVHYTHRLDLLPGTYRIMFTVDGTTHPYSIDVQEPNGMTEILRTDAVTDVAGRHTPFEFDGRQVNLNPSGRFAMVAVARPGKVTWMVRKGFQLVWRSTSDAQQVSMVELPFGDLAPGPYKLEAVSDEGSRSADFVIQDDKHAAETTLLSFNANLRPELRLAFIGHQWLLRGKLDQATRSLEASLAQSPTRQASIEMSRLDAAAGRYDQARERLRPILEKQPKDFDALSVLAYVEAGLQDYEVAATLYRRALAVEDSPALRLALENLPRH